MNTDPVFLVSVPRSGSTMLRLVLDSHPMIFSTVELPWIGGNYRSDGYGPEVSLRCLYRRVVNSVAELTGPSPAKVKEAVRNFLRTTIETQAASQGKQIWLEKTPDNIIQIAFLAELFPKARFIRLIRDGRDVALSTMKVRWMALNYFIESTPKNRRWINLRVSMNRRLFQKLPRWAQELFLRVPIEPAADLREPTLFYPVANTFYNALYRWEQWNRIYDSTAREAGIDQLTVKYEDILLDPAAKLGGIFEFIGVPWDERILHYGRYSHEAREGDVGDASAMRFSGINSGNVCKWRRQLTRRQRALVRKHFDDYLAHCGYLRTPLGPEGPEPRPKVPTSDVESGDPTDVVSERSSSGASSSTP